MLDRTEEEILAKAKELWPDDEYAVELMEYEVSKRDNAVAIRVKRMYDVPGLNFAQLTNLSEFFQTKNINDDDRWYYSGCETCDYGSEAGFTLTIRPDNE